MDGTYDNGGVQAAENAAGPAVGATVTGSVVDREAGGDPSDRSAALALARFLRDANALDVKVLFLGADSSIADYFVIATVESFGKLRGILRNVTRFLADRDITVRNGAKRPEDDGWTLLDCGNIIVHLMTPATRAFYDLERIWFQAPDIASANG